MVSHHSFKVAHLEITEDATLTGALSRYTDRKKCDFRLRVSGLRVWRSYVDPYCFMIKASKCRVHPWIEFSTQGVEFFVVESFGW